MKYEDAIRVWGAYRLKNYYGSNLDGDGINFDSVEVKFEFEEGFACCGGSDPNCYCSFAESPRADVAINGIENKGRYVSMRISIEDFDFATVLRELCEISDGSIEISL